MTPLFRSQDKVKDLQQLRLESSSQGGRREALRVWHLTNKDKKVFQARDNGQLC